MNDVLRITLRDHIVASVFPIIIIICLIILLIYNKLDEASVAVCGAAFLIFVMPGLYLHIEYWWHNKGEKYKVRSDALIRYKDGKEKHYKVEDIEYIRVLMSPSLYQNWYFHFMAIEQYHYARVYLKNGEQLIITCLLTPRVDKALNKLTGVKIVKKKWLFNTTFMEKVPF